VTVDILTTIDGGLGSKETILVVWVQVR